MPHISWAHDMEWTGIKQIQLLQEKQGKLRIQVVKNDSFSESEVIAHLHKIYEPRFKGLCDLHISFVNHIERTKRGKYQFLIQKLPIEFIGSSYIKRGN